MQECIDYCVKAWQDGGVAVEGLKDIIRIPNLSPAYDTEFLTNGLIHKAIETAKTWIEAQGINGLVTKVYAEPGHEPLLRVNIPGTAPNAKPVLTYGHLDKMPHLDAEGWAEGLSATNPVIRGDKIYGRGTNDDCYCGFLVITALKYLQDHNIPYPKITMLLETGEESGDEEITAYLRTLRGDIGDVGVIMVLDAEAQDYKTVWCCTSLRGVVMGTLDVQHLSTPCHSGMATGLVPSTFRIVRMLLSRIEDQDTGEIKLKEAHLPQLPQDRLDMCNTIASQLGEASVEIVAPLEGAKLLSEDRGSLLVNKAWKPGLAVTGCDGVPAIADGSNVMRPRTALKLSLRIPPGVKAEEAQKAMKATLEANPPYGAKVVYTPLAAGNGWYGHDFHSNVQNAIIKATDDVFGQKPLFYGEGGSIPLCNVFTELWPEADVFVTGCAGTDSNPHGYNESLDLPYTGKFTAVVCSFLESYAK